jgi:hypothetical protein
MEGFTVTVTDGDQTATTDATGAWSLSLPTGATLAPMIVGPSYTQLFLPDVVAGNDFDRGTTVTASADTFHFAEGVLAPPRPSRTSRPPRHRR